MTQNRKPKGYVGINHTTRGGDILAVMQTIHLPEQTLGPDLAARMRKVKVEEWYPIGDLIEVLEKLDQKLGSFHLRQVGWTIFNKFHRPHVEGKFKNAKELLEAFNAMYHEGNRGTQIGGWKLVSMEPGRAVMEKATPHHCHMEEGIVAEALRAINVPVTVTQARCFRKGDPICVYHIDTTANDERWMPRED